MSTPFVVIFGISTVFVGLAIIIILCKLMSFFVMLTEKEPKVEANVPAPSIPSKNAPIEDKGAVIAAIASVVAEELGTDISNIRIHSIKRV